MKIFKFIIALFLSASMFIACQNNAQKAADSNTVSTENLGLPGTDLAKIDAAVQALEGQAQSAWAKIDKKELMVSSEGGQWHEFYDKNNKLKKAHADIYGETGQMKELFYLDDNGEIMFYVVKAYEYNVPLNYMSVMSDIGTPVADDFEITIVDSTITTAYMHNGKLLKLTASDGQLFDSEKFALAEKGIPSDFKRYKEEATQAIEE